jgi:hypothetical protein
LNAKEKSTQSQPEGDLIKRDLNFFKRRKNENQFGIEIKSINSRIISNVSDFENGFKLKRELYQLVPPDPARHSKEGLELQ